MSNIQGDLQNVLNVMLHLVSHVFPMTIIPAIIGGFVWAKTRR